MLWVVVSMAFVSLCGVLAMGVAAAFKLRVPLPLWVAGPMTTVSLGTIGTLYGQSHLQDALMWATESTNSMAWAGHGAALLTNIAGYYSGSMVMLASVWALGIALAIAPGEEPKWTAGLAFMALLFPLTAACGTGVFAVGTAAWGAPLVLLFGAPALAIGMLRGTEEPHLQAGRMALAAMLTLATLWAALGDVAVAERALTEVWLGSWLETMEVLEGQVTRAELNIHGAVLGGGVNVLAASSLMLVSAAVGRSGLDLRGGLGVVLVGGALLVPFMLEGASRWIAEGYLPITW
jgi:hypothetical protein